MLVAGFPCQDYSIANSQNKNKGIIGKKGILWWQIYRILKEKGNKKPKYLLLENVDRLLKSPTNQRGRDFAIMISSLSKLGYAVEWKIINAADYGMPQRRKRVFILGYHKSTLTYQKILSRKENWILKHGVFARAFKSVMSDEKVSDGILSKNLNEMSNNFNKKGSSSPFKTDGIMIKGKFWTFKSKPKYNGKQTVLQDILLPNSEIEYEFIIKKKDLKRWFYLKGAKKEKRYNKAKDIFYNYNEGSMIFPDALNKPSRTIITSEGGKSPSRFKHVVSKGGKLRRLTPIELERLNMFPDNHTKLDGITNNKRAFLMGNALVVGVIEKIAKVLAREIRSNQK